MKRLATRVVATCPPRLTHAQGRNWSERNLSFGARATRLAGSMGTVGLTQRPGLLGGGESQLAPGPWVKSARKAA